MGFCLSQPHKAPTLNQRTRIRTESAGMHVFGRLLYGQMRAAELSSDRKPRTLWPMAPEFGDKGRELGSWFSGPQKWPKAACEPRRFQARQLSGGEFFFFGGGRVHG